ncbi:MAG: gliding-motility protein MglA [Bdellovibrionales bacterium RBG_16_40_8]|nr:MAG: gliding-motility protein MglA [Bdellovibrionales bacterium RBG_16_40_8]
MSFINYNAKEIHCKIVYYGPSLSGKTTNLQWVYNKSLSPEKSDLISLPTDIERTLFFDFLPMDIGEIRGFRTRFHLYTVPGQVVYDASRKLILKGLDGIIFVADSQTERMEENIQSLNNLEKNLEQQGYDIRNVPLAIQYNKRDLPNASPLSELRNALNRFNAPDFEGAAREGKGVFEALKTVSKAIITSLKGGDV